MSTVRRETSTKDILHYGKYALAELRAKDGGEPLRDETTTSQLAVGDRRKITGGTNAGCYCALLSRARCLAWLYLAAGKEKLMSDDASTSRRYS